MRFKQLYFLTIICLLCYSCSYKQQHVLFEQKTPSATDNATLSAPPAPYQIKADDQLQIRNLQDPRGFANESSGAAGGQNNSLGQNFQVEEDGNVALPVLGHVKVAGLTRYQAAKKIEQLLRDSALVDPIIELKILNLKVTVFGEIKSPGNFGLVKENTSLIDVLGQGGGLSNSADEKHIKIIRADKSGPKTIWVDLSDINILNDPKIILQDKDIIYIAQNKRAIRDDKLQNFTTLVQPTILIFNTALIIYSLFR
ncbi:MAG: polysaccharide biosynthesis/export family protein [Bacteroidota bacterium]